MPELSAVLIVTLGLPKWVACSYDMLINGGGANLSHVSKCFLCAVGQLLKIPTIEYLLARLRADYMRFQNMSPTAPSDTGGTTVSISNVNVGEM